MTSTSVLNDHLLAELEARWREQGAAVSALLRPGLDDRRMSAAASAAGLRLPAEARRWWGWHDGARPQGPEYAAELGPNIQFLSLQQALNQRDEMSRLMTDLLLGPNDARWRPDYLPINAQAGPIVFDCGVGEDDPVPVRSIVLENPNSGKEVAAASIGELVQLWIDAIDRGAWRYLKDDQRWLYDWQRLLPAVARLGIV